MVERALEIEASLESLPAVALWLRDASREARVPYAVAFGLDLALHEAVENVVRHGYGASAAGGRIRLRFRCDGERIELDVEDDASAFDPSALPAPALAERVEDVIPGGQGIQLMRHFTDELRYRREGGTNVLTLTRALSGDGGGR